MIVETKRAIHNHDYKFFLTDGGAVVCQTPIAPDCIWRIDDRNGRPIWTGPRVGLAPIMAPSILKKTWEGTPSVKNEVRFADDVPAEDSAAGNRVRDSRNESGEPVRDVSYALVKHFYWAGHVKAPSLSIYTDKYPNGHKMSTRLKAGEDTGEIFHISLSQDGGFLCGYLPHLAGFINL